MAIERDERLTELEAFAREFLGAVSDGSVISNPDFDSDDCAWLADKARAALSPSPHQQKMEN